MNRRKILLLLISSVILLSTAVLCYSLIRTPKTDILKNLAEEVGDRLVLESNGSIIGYVKDAEGQVICYLVNSTLFNRADNNQEVIDRLLQGTPVIFIGAPELKKLQYPWPGNVSELETTGGPLTMPSNCKIYVVKVYENTSPRGARKAETASFNEESAINLAYHWAEERYTKKILS